MSFLRVKRDDFRVRYLTNLLPDLHQIWTAYRGWQFVAGVGLVRLTRGEKRGVKVGLVESNRGWDKKSCTFNLWCENEALNRSGASGDFRRTSVLMKFGEQVEHYRQSRPLSLSSIEQSNHQSVQIAKNSCWDFPWSAVVDFELFACYHNSVLLRPW